MSRRKNTEADEVEELLRVAEDDLLLKLSVNSHLKSDRPIDSDLDSRFQSLKLRSSKSKPKPKSNQSSSSVVLPNPPPPPAAIGDFDGDRENPDFDNLLARFAALKGTLPSNSSSTTTITSTAKNQLCKSDEDDEDEVDKVIRWAIDAARLDPSPGSDDDEEDCDTHSDDDDDSDTDDDDFRDVKHKEGRKK